MYNERKRAESGGAAVPRLDPNWVRLVVGSVVGSGVVRV